MRILFMGTPEFAVPSLRALVGEHEVLGVVTQPDRRAGRGQRGLCFLQSKRSPWNMDFPFSSRRRSVIPRSWLSWKRWAQICL